MREPNCSSTSTQRQATRQAPQWPPGPNEVQAAAGQSVWWPGLSRQLEQLIGNCRECLKTLQQRPQPLNSTPLPILPWQKVGSDLFEWQQSNYLLVVDYYSRFIEIARLNRTTTAEVDRRHTSQEHICASRDTRDPRIRQRTSVFLSRVQRVCERILVQTHHFQSLPSSRKW